MGAGAAYGGKPKAHLQGVGKSRVLAVKLRHQSLPVPRERRVLGEEGIWCVPWLSYRSPRKRESGGSDSAVVLLRLRASKY